MKKILSMALSALLICSALFCGSAVAFADDSALRQNLQDPSGGNAALTENVELTSSIVVTNGSHTLDLAGKTLSIGNAATDHDGKVPAIIVKGGNLTIRDSVGGGSISVFGNLTSGVEVDGGSLTLKSGAIKVTGHDAPLGVLVMGNGSFAMNGGSVSVSGALTIGVTVSGEADLVMSGGSVVASGTSSAIGVYVDGTVLASRVRLAGGYISGTTYSVSISDQNKNYTGVNDLLSSGVSVTMDGKSYTRGSFPERAYSSDLSIGGAAAPDTAAAAPAASASQASSSQAAAAASGDADANPETGAKIRTALLWIIPIVLVAVCVELAVSAAKRKKAGRPSGGEKKDDDGQNDDPKPQL